MDPRFTAEQIEDFKSAFKALDKNADGVITADELGDVMRSLGQNFPESELQALVDELDLDKTGSLDFEEFLAAMAAKTSQPDPEDELRKAFRVFDQDDSGTISAAELRQVMKSLGENLNQGEIEELIRQADRDGDGMIDYNEFVRFMKEK